MDLDILKNLTKEELDIYGLVLSSSNISYRVSRGEYGWDINVHDGAYEKAHNAIVEYLKENQPTRPKREFRPSGYQKTFSGLWVAIILLVLYAFITISHNNQAFIKTYGK